MAMIFSTWVYHASSGYEPKNMCEHVAKYVNISKIFQDCASLTSASYIIVLCLYHLVNKVTGNDENLSLSLGSRT
jgi:hypothetical protein